MSVVVPKPAATVIVARQGPEGLEILVVRRGPGTTFGPGFVTFPGGSIDEEDQDLAQRWFGHAGDVARAAAVRELAEETEMVVGSEGPRRLRPGEDVVAAISADPPRREDLPQIARWVAPEFLEVRFDARFFAVAAPFGIDAVVDGEENDRAWWAKPADVLAEHQLGSSLMWPTFHTLRGLAECTTVEDVLSLQLEQVAPPMPRPS
ncbi:MAG: NUDIX domain-containing protein [Actinomycetota bacterium]